MQSEKCGSINCWYTVGCYSPKMDEFIWNVKHYTYRNRNKSDVCKL